jgi:hypothetical protein
VNSRSDNLDFITRYFLRRLAIARRNPNNNAGSAFFEAKLEVTLVVIALPLLGLVGFLLLGSLHWISPAEAARHPLPNKTVAVLTVWGLCTFAGNIWLNRRYARYATDPTLCQEFDSERDREIVGWQRFAVFVICAIVLPGLGLAFALVGGN